MIDGLIHWPLLVLQSKNEFDWERKKKCAKCDERRNRRRKALCSSYKYTWVWHRNGANCFWHRQTIVSWMGDIASQVYIALSVSIRPKFKIKCKRTRMKPTSKLHWSSIRPKCYLYTHFRWLLKIKKKIRADLLTQPIAHFQFDRIEATHISLSHFVGRPLIMESLHLFRSLNNICSAVSMFWFQFHCESMCLPTHRSLCCFFFCHKIFHWIDCC